MDWTGELTLKNIFLHILMTHSPMELCAWNPAAFSAAILWSWTCVEQIIYSAFSISEGIPSMSLTSHPICYSAKRPDFSDRKKSSLHYISILQLQCNALASFLGTHLKSQQFIQYPIHCLFLSFYKPSLLYTATL